MKAVVVYESVFGNTRSIAEAISNGLGERNEVSVFEVSEADYSLLDGADLLVVGGPTYILTMSHPSTRKAAEQLKKETQDRKAVSVGIGIREWLNKLPQAKGVVAAAFDTRMPKKSIMPVSFASRRMASKLRKRGYRIIVKPEGFVVVDAKGPLAEGELERAGEWGRAIAAAVIGQNLSGKIVEQTLAGQV